MNRNSSHQNVLPLKIGGICETGISQADVNHANELELF